MGLPVIVLTSAGAALLAKTPIGASIPVTGWKIGTGALPVGTNLQNQTELVSPLAEAPIASVEPNENQCLITGQFVNTGMAAFNWEETGLFASDPDNGTILFAYGNSFGSGEAIPAGSSQLREIVFGAQLVFDVAPNITAVINQGLVFATLMQLNQRIPNSEKGEPNGVATLGADGKLVEDQRPDATGVGAADRTLSNLTNPQTAIYNLGAGVRPNLLINGNFRVNQRKKTVYNSAGITVDGWFMTADTVTVNVTDNGISYKNTNGAGDSYYLQKIPVSEMELNKPYTASVLFQSGSPTKYAEFVCWHPSAATDGYTVFKGLPVNDDGISTVTFTPPADTTSMEFRACSADYGETGEFTAICAKLEQGETQTLARQTSNGNWEQIQQP